MTAAPRRTDRRCTLGAVVIRHDAPAEDMTAGAGARRDRCAAGGCA